jgi:hypothetical protein
MFHRMFGLFNADVRAFEAFHNIMKTLAGSTNHWDTAKDILHSFNVNAALAPAAVPRDPRPKLIPFQLSEVDCKLSDGDWLVPGAAGGRCCGLGVAVLAEAHHRYEECWLSTAFVSS